MTKPRSLDRPWLLVLAVGGALGCVGGGGGGAGAEAPQPSVDQPAPAPGSGGGQLSPENPACLPASERAKVLTATSDGAVTHFCAEAGLRGCFSFDARARAYARHEQAFSPQPASLAAPTARVDTTVTQVRICKSSDSDDCQILRPPGDSSIDPINAAIDSAGTRAAIVNGIATSGYQVVEVWDVASAQRSKVIFYAKDAGNDQRCGFPQVLDDVIFISATNCETPTASGLLYSAGGDLIGRVGGTGFGTYRTQAVQVNGSQWAFLEERARAIAIQDVKTGQVIKSLDLTPLWAETAEKQGAPGGSAMVRGAEGTLIVIAGAPLVGAMAVVNVQTGEVATVRPPACDPAK